MDPNTALYLLIDLIAQGEIGEARTNARNLEHWLTMGGFYPEGLETNAGKQTLMALFNALSMTRATDSSL